MDAQDPYGLILTAQEVWIDGRVARKGEALLLEPRNCVYTPCQDGRILWVETRPPVTLQLVHDTDDYV